MNDLKDLIVAGLQIPYIDENTPVFDGSFTMTPIYNNGLSGNGIVKTSTTLLNVDLFYTDKIDCVDSAVKLWRTISETKGMASEAPDYTYEESANMWRATLAIELVNKED